MTRRPAYLLPLLASTVAVTLAALTHFGAYLLPALPAQAAAPQRRLPQLAPAQTCLAGDDFEDNALHGWTSQSTTVFELRPGGPAPSRSYLHAKDGSGASTLSAPAPYLGDLVARLGGCGTVCFDVNLFNDGEPGSPGIAANFYLYSGATIAQFLAYPISEPGGPNPGWHRICAPLRLAAGDTLPASPDGQWRVNGATGGAAAVAAWNSVLRNVTALRLPVDWGSSSQTEEVGYDNFCLSAVACPTPSPTGGTPAAITGVIRTARGCNEDPATVEYRQGEVVNSSLHIEGARSATVRVMYQWPAGGQEREVDGGPVDGGRSYVVNPVDIPTDAAVGGRRLSLQLVEAGPRYRELAVCSFAVATIRPTVAPPRPTFAVYMIQPNLPQEPNLNPPVSGAVALNSAGIGLVPEPCAGCASVVATKAATRRPKGPKPIPLLPDPLIAPDEPWHLPRSDWQLPFHAWGSGATVNLRSGELIVEETDLAVPGRGFDFTLRRRYRSGITYRGPLGHNWDLNVNPRLLVLNAELARPYGEVLDRDLAPGDVLRMDGSGRVDVYRRQPDGSFTRPDGFFTRLDRSPEGMYFERDRSGSLAIYSIADAEGFARLTQVQDRHGNSLRFDGYEGRLTPARIIDSLGRVITFEHDAADRISAVSDFAGRRWTYSYDAHGDLVAVTSPPVSGGAPGNDFPTGKTTRYSYATSVTDTLRAHNLVAVTAPNEVLAGGPPRLTVAYDGQDRVTRVSMGGTNASGIPAGGSVTYAYAVLPPPQRPNINTPLHETTVTDANGNRRGYQFNFAGNIVTLDVATNRDINPRDPAAYVTRYEYSGEGQLLRTTLPEGNVLRQEYDDANPDPLQRGNLLATLREPDADRGGDQAALRTSYAYEPLFNRIRTVTDPRGKDPTYQPPNGGAATAARYTTTYVYDYQEGDNAAGLAALLGIPEAQVRARLAAAGIPMNLGDVNGDGRTDLVAGDLVRVDRPVVQLPPESKLAEDFGPEQPAFELYGYNERGQLRFAMDAEGNLTRYEYYPENDPDGDGRDLIAELGNGPFGYLRAEIRDAGQNPPFVDLTPRPEVTASPGLPNFATATALPEDEGAIYLPVTYKNVAARAGVVRTAGGATAERQAAGPQPAVAGGGSAAVAAGPAQEPVEPAPPPWRNLEGRRFFLNLRTEYGYDRVGNTTWALNPRGVREDYLRNSVGQLVETVRAADVQEALNNEQEPNWPACRDLTLVECARGMVAFRQRTRLSYDANDNLVKLERESRDALDPTLAGPWVATTYGYDILDQVVAEERTVGPARSVRRAYRYDRNGNLVLSLSPLALAGATEPQPDNLTSTVFDERDGAASTSAGGVTEQFRTLAAHADIPELAALPAGLARSTTTYRYDGNGNRSAVTDALDNSGDGRPETTTTLYDGFDRELSIVDGLGNQSFNRYDPAGHVVRLSVYGPVGGASPSGDQAASFAQPLTEAALTQPLLSRVEVRYDERDRAYEERAGLFVSQGVSLLRPAVLAEGPDDAPGDGWVVSRSEYDRKNRLVYAWDDGGDRTSQLYDGDDRRVWTRDPLGNETQHGFDQAGNEVRTVRTEVTREGEVAAGQVPELRLRYVTQRQFDALDRQIREIDDLGRTQRWRYDSLDQEIEATDAQHSSRDADLIVDPLGTYAAPGQAEIGRINRPGNATLSYHDGLGRVVTRAFPLRLNGQGANALDTRNPANRDGLVTLHNTWDDADRLLAQTDDKGNATQSLYDAQDRPVRRTLADGSVYELAYDLDGHLVRNTDPNGNTLTFGVDGLGRRTALNVAPGAGIVGTTRQSWQYDGLGRLRLALDEGGTAGAGDDVTIGFAYDSLDRVLEEQQNNLAVSSRWSGDGDRLALVYPNGRTLAIQRDGAGQLDRITEQPGGGAPVTLADYDFAGPDRLLLRRSGNGVAWTMLNDARSAADGYDGAGQLVRSRHLTVGGQLVAGFAYGHNRAGVPRYEDKLHDPANGEMYPYDSLGRMVDYRRGRLNAAGDGLTAPSTNAMPRQTWRLDGVGNWAETSRSVAGALQLELREHSAIHALTKAGATALKYDANGNLVDDGTRLYSWDGLNRLRRVARKSNGAELALYGYDAVGRRASKIVSNSAALDGVFRYYLDGAHEIEERNGAGQLTRQYVYGADLDEPVLLDADLDGDGLATGAADRRLYHHQNGQLSVFALTDGAGKAVEGYQYDPYGRPIVYAPGPNGQLDWGGDDLVTPGGASALGNSLLYTGRRWEPETGLYYYRARYLSPALGRFISQDPLGAWGAENLGNAYAYVADMPQAATDPSGMVDKSKTRSNVGITKTAAAGKGIPGITIGLTKPPGTQPQSAKWPRRHPTVTLLPDGVTAMGGVTKGYSNIKSQRIVAGNNIVVVWPTRSGPGGPASPVPCPPIAWGPSAIGIDEEGVSTKMVRPGGGPGGGGGVTTQQVACAEFKLPGNCWALICWDNVLESEAIGCIFCPGKGMDCDLVKAEWNTQ